MPGRNGRSRAPAPPGRPHPKASSARSSRSMPVECAAAGLRFVSVPPLHHSHVLSRDSVGRLPASPERGGIGAIGARHGPLAAIDPKRPAGRTSPRNRNPWARETVVPDHGAKGRSGDTSTAVVAVMQSPEAGHPGGCSSRIRFAAWSRAAWNPVQGFPAPQGGESAWKRSSGHSRGPGGLASGRRSVSSGRPVPTVRTACLPPALAGLAPSPTGSLASGSTVSC